MSNEFVEISEDSILLPEFEYNQNQLLYETQNLVPDFLMRVFIRNQIGKKSTELKKFRDTSGNYFYQKFIEKVSKGPIDLTSDRYKNYEPDYLNSKWILGPLMSTTTGTFLDTRLYDKSLGQAEKRMVQLIAERAGVNSDGSRSETNRKGKRILDLGCGWGALSIYLSAVYRNFEVYAVTTSKVQEKYIRQIIKEKAITNLYVKYIASYNLLENDPSLEAIEQFDYVFAIETFQCFQNWKKALEVISEKFLKENGKLFVHTVTHSVFPLVIENYTWFDLHFLSKENSNSMLIPDQNLIYRIINDIRANTSCSTKNSEGIASCSTKNSEGIASCSTKNSEGIASSVGVSRCWTINGKDYSRTHETWLENLDTNWDKLFDSAADNTLESLKSTRKSLYDYIKKEKEEKGRNGINFEEISGSSFRTGNKFQGISRSAIFNEENCKEQLQILEEKLYTLTNKKLTKIRTGLITRSEAFKYNNGNEMFIMQYLITKN